jgi:acyl carrier protein
MDNGEVMSRLTGVFQRVFDEETLSLTRSTTAQDVEGWDSLMHINLIVAIEREFKVRFSTREIAKLQNVGELIDLIVGKEGVRSQSA